MEVPTAKSANPLQSTNLNQFLIQVDKLASAYEQLRADTVVLKSELDLAKSAAREAEKRTLAAEAALNKKTLPTEKGNQLEFPEYVSTTEYESQRDDSVHDVQFSPQLPPNQAIQAIDRKVIQALLNDVDSCIALLQS